MSFTDEEKVRIRQVMGYLNVEAVSTFNLGVPAAVQTQFMIEGALFKVLPGAEDLVRKWVCRAEAAEEEVFGNLDLANVTKTAMIEVNAKRLNELAKIYRLAQTSLGNLFGVPPNPFDMREWIQSGAGGLNVPVR